MKPFKSDLQAVEALIFAHKGKDAANYQIRSYKRILCPYCAEHDVSTTLWEMSQIFGETGTRKAYRAAVCEECGVTDGENESYTY